MPAYKQMSDTELNALIEFIKTLLNSHSETHPSRPIIPRAWNRRPGIPHVNQTCVCFLIDTQGVGDMLQYRREGA